MRFFNVTCKGETGILIYGTKKNTIDDLYFENVSVEVKKTSKWDCGYYDLRPCLEYGVEKQKNSAVFIRNAKNIEFCRCSLSIDKSYDGYNAETDVENSEGVSFE